MKNVWRKRNGTGFTLVELLVVIGIIAILASLLFPAIQGALTKSKMIKTMNNGRSIFLALQATQLEREAASLPSIWPSSTTYANSTDYFKSAITNNWMEGFDYSFLSAPQVDPPSNPTNTTTFSESNNAWCITRDMVDGDPSSMPILLTRNMGPDLTVSGNRNLNALLNLNNLSGNDYAKPFGDKGCVIVTKGGSAKIMKKDEVTQVNINPGSLNRPILVPRT